MRCNAGVDPSILADQHLIAEYRELLIPVGQLKKLNWKSRSPIPAKLSLGKGHITFWRDKQIYLKRRHDALVEEMIRRGFQPNFRFWGYDQVPAEFWNDWEPSEEDSHILRERIFERIMQKPSWYRFKKGPLPDGYEKLLFESPVTY